MKHVNEVENEFNKFSGLCDTIQQVHESLLGLFPADEANKHEIWFQAKMLNINEFIVGSNQWLSDTKACPATKVDDDPDHDDDFQTVKLLMSVLEMERRSMPAKWSCCWKG